MCWKILRKQLKEKHLESFIQERKERQYKRCITEQNFKIKLQFHCGTGIVSGYFAIDATVWGTMFIWDNKNKNKQDKVNYAVSEREDRVTDLTTLRRMTGCTGMYWALLEYLTWLGCTGIWLVGVVTGQVVQVDQWSRRSRWSGWSTWSRSSRWTSWSRW